LWDRRHEPVRILQGSRDLFVGQEAVLDAFDEVVCLRGAGRGDAGACGGCCRGWSDLAERGPLAGAVVRASTKAYQSYKEGKKSLFEGAPVRGGSPRTGDEFWRDQGEQAAGSMNDDDLVAFHSGGAKALVYADDDSEYSLVDISGISDAGGRGFDNVIAIGLKDGPSAAVAYMNGVRSNLESRNFSPTVVAPPRPLVGGVIGGGAGSTSSGGVAGLSQ